MRVIVCWRTILTCYLSPRPPWNRKHARSLSPRARFETSALQRSVTRAIVICVLVRATSERNRRSLARRMNEADTRMQTGVEACDGSRVLLQLIAANFVYLAVKNRPFFFPLSP